MSASDTVTQLLDVAQRLVQERGYNAFSYKDLADEVGIKTASIHYHFGTKADLAVAMVERYAAGLEDALARIDSNHRACRARLKAFVGIYRETEHAQRICLCGSMASDQESLSDAARRAVGGYLERNEVWVTDTIRAGQRAGEFEPAGRPKDLATMLVSGLQGGLMLSRMSPDSCVIDAVERTFFSLLPRA